MGRPCLHTQDARASKIFFQIFSNHSIIAKKKKKNILSFAFPYYYFVHSMLSHFLLRYPQSHSHLPSPPTPLLRLHYLRYSFEGLQLMTTNRKRGHGNRAETLLLTDSWIQDALPDFYYHFESPFHSRTYCLTAPSHLESLATTKKPRNNIPSYSNSLHSLYSVHVSPHYSHHSRNKKRGRGGGRG